MADDYMAEARKYRMRYEAAVEMLRDKDIEIAKLKAELSGNEEENDRKRRC